MNFLIKTNHNYSKLQLIAKMFRPTMLFTLLSILSLSSSIKLKGIDKYNCSLPNDINCTIHSVELIGKRKIPKLLPKKKKSKNTKLIEFEYP